MTDMKNYIQQIPPIAYAMGDIVVLKEGVWRSVISTQVVRDEFVNNWGVILEPQTKPTPADVKDAHE